MTDNNKGVWFQSATSGLWYENYQAAGDILFIKIDGVIHQTPQIVMTDNSELIEPDNLVGKTVRAFWRRIYPYRNNFERELPEPLPVEFEAHMTTALSFVDDLLEQQAQQIVELEDTNKDISQYAASQVAKVRELEEREQGYKSNAAFYRCCILSGEVPRDGAEPFIYPPRDEL